MMDRPYALEVWEDGKWVTWSTYVAEKNARDRLAQLTAKGHRARVTGPPPPAACPYCDESHPAPYDGRCLI